MLHSCVTPFPLFLSLKGADLHTGTEWHFKPNSPFFSVSWLQTNCLPVNAWQYPSFLFISHLWGRRKWITVLSRRGTGAITVERSKRNFDIWGLLAFYSCGAFGVCCGTSHWPSLAAKANRPVGVISSAHLFNCLHLPQSDLSVPLPVFDILCITFSFTHFDW